MKLANQKTAKRSPSRWVRADIYRWVADQIEKSTGVRPVVDETDIRFISIETVTEIVSLKKSAIYALIAKGQFPRQVHLALGEKAA